MKVKQLLLALTTLVIFSSCEKEALRADGHKISEVRNPGAFHSIKASGSNKVHITYGNEFKVELTGSSNLVQVFNTNVVSRVLYLSYNRDRVKNDDVEIFVTMPAMEKLSFEGSGDAGISGAFPAMPSLIIEFEGSGNIKALNGLTADHLSVKLKGSNVADLTNVEAKFADVSINGSGKANVSVSQQLNADINGSGDINYNGSPAVNTKISGSGKVQKI